MPYAGGTTLTVMDKAFDLSEVTRMYVDETKVTDSSVKVVFSDTKTDVTVAGNIAKFLTVSQSGAHVSIAQSEDTDVEITYTLSGTSSDGGFYTEGAYKATVELDNLNLTNVSAVYSGAAIHVQNGKRIKMADAGLTGFVDRGGHNWSPEAYVRMDIRTTCGNVATQSVFARNADYGNDLIWVRTKAAARPGCFPYQGGVFSKDGRSGVTEDLRGNKIQFQPLSSTTYGEPAGLFGINCGHVPPNPFVPGFSMVRGAIDVDDPEIQKENEKLYAMSQEQRALERNVREAKRDAAMAAATGDKEMFDVYAAQAKKAQSELNDFTDKNKVADRTYLSQTVGYDRSVAARATWSVKKQNQK